MFKTLKPIFPAARWFAIVAALTLIAAPLRAQVRGARPGAYPGSLRSMPATPIPYAGYPHDFVIQSPIGGYLSGQADIINSGGQYLRSTQEANLMQEQLKQNRIDTRRRAFDQAVYEKAMTPTPSERREEKRIEEVRYARDFPAASDIDSGRALNLILQDIQKIERETGLRGPLVPLDEEMLKQINVSGGKTAGDGIAAGVLRDGTAHWPLTLTRAKFKNERELIDMLVPKLVRQARERDLHPDDLDAARNAAGKIRDELTSLLSEIGPAEYLKSSDYLRQLQSSLKLFAEPNAADFFNGIMTAKGQSVGELADHMGRNGLTFVRATPGDERAYAVIQQSLAAYDIQLRERARHSMVAAPPRR
jgi:hypothetical protein